MDVIGDLVAPERRCDDIAFRLGGRSGSYTYDAACTGAWKAGNLLRQYGVRSGATVAVDPGVAPTAQPLLAFFGTTLLGATVRFDPPEDTDATALVAPVAGIDTYDPGPGTTVLAYGAVPETSGVAHFEREVWSENPTPPPEEVEPTAVALGTAERSYTHERLLALAGAAADELGLGRDDEIALRSPLSHPGTLVGGVLAPLSAGASILIDPDLTGTAAVGAADAPEDRVLDPESAAGVHSGSA